MVQVRPTALTMSAARNHRYWSMPSRRGYNFVFGTKTTKADGFGTWSFIG